MSKMRSVYWALPRIRMVWTVFAIIYLIGSLTAIWISIANASRLVSIDPQMKALIVILGLVWFLFPTFYWWLTSWHFEEWIVEQRFPDDKQLDFERERFKTNREHALAVWAALIAALVTSVISAKWVSSEPFSAPVPPITSSATTR